MRKSQLLVLFIFLMPFLGFVGNQLVVKTWSIVKNQNESEPLRDSFRETTSSYDSNQPVQVPEATPLSMKFHRTGVFLLFLYKAFDIIFPFLILFTGFHLWIGHRPIFDSRRRFYSLGLFVFILVAFRAVLLFPMDLYSTFVRPHEYGLSNQLLSKWLADWLKEFGLSMLGIVLVTYLVFFLIIRSPRRWYLSLTALFLPLALFLMMIKPLWIDPLFNEFAALEDKSLEADVVMLARKAGVNNPSVYEVKKSADTKAVNAYVTGFLGAKRIVIWDNTIHKLSRPQVLFIVGHELGHYVLNHIVWTICASTFACLFITWLVHRTSSFLIPKWRQFLGFKDLSDMLSIPWIVLWFQIYLFVFSPLMMAYSRSNEASADRFGLELTRDGVAAASSFVTIQRENLRVPRPLPVYTLFFATHPSLAERIATCNQYRKRDDPNP